MIHPVLLRQPLAAAGFPPAALAAYQALVTEASAALDEAGVPADQRRTWLVPGRIEVLGKHVDYAGGRSLLCTVERGLAIVGRARDDGTVVLRDARRREALQLPLDRPSRSAIPWSVYPCTVINRLRRNFGAAVQGMDIALASNLPSAAGVSSSSALTVGLTLALASRGQLDAHPRWQQAIGDRAALAGYVGALENGNDFGVLGGHRGVGTLGGAQDQTAILCSDQGRLDVFSWAPVVYERSAPWPSSHAFVVGVSGVVASKSGAAKERYNRAARTVHRLVDAWNAQTDVPVRTLREAFVAAAGGAIPADVPAALRTVAERAGNAEFTSVHLVARLEQFFEETFVLVPGAADALVAGDVATFGTLVDRSQAGAERALENQIAETVHLQRYARDLGADAASAFGAGFGGSVWAMVTAADADRFAARWREQYLRGHPAASPRTQFFVSRPAPPAFEVTED